jgi:hypothetical protein
VNASWWANINNESGAINNYFIIQRGGRWLVWLGFSVIA